jgi:hypothetical protein
VAGLLKAPEFELDKDEARMLAENMANVAAQYSVTVDPKYMAWIGFIGCLIAIYGPRIGAVAIRKNAKHASSEKPREEMRSPLQAVPVQPFVPPTSFSQG